MFLLLAPREEGPDERRVLRAKISAEKFWVLKHFMDKSAATVTVTCLEFSFSCLEVRFHMIHCSGRICVNSFSRCGETLSDWPLKA